MYIPFRVARAESNFKGIVFLSILFSTSFLCPIFSQITDSSQVQKHPQLTTILLSTAAIGYGVAGTYIPPLRKWNRDLQAKLQANAKIIPHYEDGIQYLPLLTVFTMDLTKYKPKNTFVAQTWQLAISIAVMSSAVNSVKYSTKIRRPDGSSRNSFPSGHTATAFVAAEFLNQELGHRSAWFSIAGYTTAASVGYLRMYNNRHWLPDVMAGAGVGILSTKLAYYIYPKLAANWRAKHPKTNANSVLIQPIVGYKQMGFVLLFK